jgi:dUTP pyrophosphatase
MIKLKKLHENALLPKYQTEGAIAFDLHSTADIKWVQCDLSQLNTDEETMVYLNNNFPENLPIFTAIVPTGLAIELPENTGMFLYPRSGWGFNFNIGLANGTGLIDSDFRGEIMIKLIAIAPKKLPNIKIGDRVAQATITKVEKPELCFVDELNDTERGTGGFGHTGHK